VGRRLAEEMLEHLRGRGATTVRTLVDEEMADIAEFFERLGFEPVPMRSFAKKL
jgi:ribosomal protein S18 acetylase RimI-like enzyme